MCSSLLLKISQETLMEKSQSMLKLKSNHPTSPHFFDTFKSEQYPAGKSTGTELCRMENLSAPFLLL